MLQNVKHMISPLLSASQISAGYAAVMRSVKKAEEAANQEIIHGPTTKCNARSLESILFVTMILTPMIIEDINISIELNWIVWYFDLFKHCYNQSQVQTLQRNWPFFNQLCMFLLNFFLSAFFF